MNSNHLSTSTNTALKSELLKAKFAFDLQRTSRTSANTQRQSSFHAKNKLSNKHEEQSTQDSTSWETCYASLLNKSKYYEECVENNHVDDSSENVLVDFSTKGRVTVSNTSPLPSNISAWVECVDEFGRTRVIRRGHELRCSTGNHAFSEVRNKSVGFIQLSTDEAYKQRQLEALRALHHSTLEARTMNSLIKEQKRLKIERRLALASNRRLAFISGD